MFLTVKKAKIGVTTAASRLSIAAVMVAASTLGCAQTSKPNECNLESTGFCITERVATLPLAHPTPQPGQQLNVPPSAQKKLHVELQNGLLRIDAENVTFLETLKAVSVRTGAEVQFPAGALREPIFVHLGPGKPRDVINELLKGSPFDYLVLSSDSQPDEITRVILTKASSATESTSTETPAPPASDPVDLTRLHIAGYTAPAHAAPVQTEPTEQPATANSAASQLSPEDRLELMKEWKDKMKEMSQTLAEKSGQQDPSNN
jgi:hypothetical protein